MGRHHPAALDEGGPFGPQTGPAQALSRTRATTTTQGTSGADNIDGGNETIHHRAAAAIVQVTAAANPCASAEANSTTKGTQEEGTGLVPPDSQEKWQKQETSFRVSDANGVKLGYFHVQ